MVIDVSKNTLHFLIYAKTQKRIIGIDAWKATAGRSLSWDRDIKNVKQHLPI